MVREIQIRLKGDRARFIYSDAWLDLLQQGISQIRRASYVEPDLGGWVSDLSPVGGPKLGPFIRRDEALDAEVKWLNEHKIPEPQD